MALPLLPSVVLVGTAFGAAAAQKGLSLVQTTMMSAIVFAGSSQMVVLELWRESWTWATLATVILVTATVNARMLLMGAALQPWLAGAPRSGLALTLFVFTDSSWIIGARSRAEGGRDIGVLLGAGLLFWIGWVGGTVPGYLAGAVVPEPRRWGLDLVMPIFLATFLVPLWRGRRAAIPWIVAGATALAVEALLPGYLFIVVGALAGAVTGALVDEHG